MKVYHSLVLGWQGALAIQLREPLRGTELLQTAVARLRADGHGGLRHLLSVHLADGFLSGGETALAHRIICEAIEWEQEDGPSFLLPELLRVKGEVLLSMLQTERREAEQCLLDSLRVARAHRALSFELRTAMTLARLWATSDRRDEALALLTSIYSRFSEGFQSMDLVSAARLLDELR